MSYNPKKYHNNLKEEDVIWVGVDLDGTLAESIWPQDGIGEPIHETVKWVQEQYEKGYKIIIHTSRPWSERKDIEMWCEDHGVPFKEIHCGKPFYLGYLDDKNIFLPGINGFKELELAWAAGFFDGEGSTSVARKGKHVHLRTIVSQKDTRVLERFKEAVGLGTIYNLSSGMSCWQCTSDPDSREVIIKLWPWLGDIKREQAEKAMAQSTWHNGNVDKLICKDPTHEIRPRYGENGRRCWTCQLEYLRKYKREWRKNRKENGS